jgi:hypothetical protein
MGVVLGVDAQGRSYSAVEDLTLRYSALLVGTVTDEVTGRAPRTPLQVRTDSEGVMVKTFRDGGYGLAGDAGRILPDHASTDHELRLQLAAPGYRAAATLAVSVPHGSALPVTAPQLKLRPLPVRLRGRVTGGFPDPGPVEAALVRLTGRGGQELVGLRRPLERDHSVGTPVRGLTTAGPVRQVLTRAPAGATQLDLNDASGLTGGQVIGTGWDRAVAFANIASLGPGPGQVQLAAPLADAVPVGTQVRAFSVSGAGPAPTLQRAADAGDGLLLTDTALPPSADAVRIGVPATPEVEFQAVGAVSDPAGFYTLDGVGGVLELEARAFPPGAGPPGPTRRWVLAYGQLNVVDLQLAP